MDANTVIFDLLNDEQKVLFEQFQKNWMKKFNFKKITFNHYFHYVRILNIKNSQVYKKRKHNFLHVYIMEEIKKICLSNEELIFKENIEIIENILKEKYLEIDIKIRIYIDP